MTPARSDVMPFRSAVIFASAAVSCAVVLSLVPAEFNAASRSTSPFLVAVIAF